MIETPEEREKMKLQNRIEVLKLLGEIAEYAYKPVCMDSCPSCIFSIKEDVKLPSRCIILLARDIYEENKDMLKEVKHEVCNNTC